MEESKVKTAEIIAEELWDKYSEYIDDDIMSLDSVAGSSVIKSRRLFLKAVVEASSILEARNKELEDLVKELIPIAKDGYRLHIKNACHQDFLEEDEELLSKAEQSLNKK